MRKAEMQSASPVPWLTVRRRAAPVQVQKLYLAEGNDRLKMLVLYSGEDDERLRRAASGTLAMLTSEQPELCARIPGTVSLHLHLADALIQSDLQ